MLLLRANPKDAALRSIAAESLRAIGELARSRDHWLRAIEAAPTRPSSALASRSPSTTSATTRLLSRPPSGRASSAPKRREVDYYAALCRSRLGEDPARLIPLLQGLMRSRMSASSDAAHGADVRLMFALGEALYRSGRPDLASGWFEKVLALAPDHELSLLYRISVAESLEEEKRRAEAYAAYLEAYPDNSKLRREYVSALSTSGDWAAAAEQLELGMPYGEMGERSRRLLAVSYRNAGRYREAALAYRDLLREEPGSGELLLGLAYCLEREGQADYALALLEKAPKAAKAGPDPWMLQAALYARAGKSEAAVSSLRSAIERDRGNERAWRNLRVPLQKTGPCQSSRPTARKRRAPPSGRRRRPGPPRPKARRIAELPARPKIPASPTWTSARGATALRRPKVEKGMLILPAMLLYLPMEDKSCP